ncbi:MAG: RND transporter, partial [Candidatus Sulfotelmatobacter sp.]
HAIAVLIGKAASNFSIPVKPMTMAPPPIPVGVPSELLERRPDIAAQRAHDGRSQRGNRHRRRGLLPQLEFDGRSRL